MAASNERGALVLGVLVHDGHVAKLKVDDLRAVLQYRAVKFDPKAKKPQLQEALRGALKLPTDGACPPLQIPDASDTAVASHEDALADDESDDESSGSSE